MARIIALTGVVIISFSAILVRAASVAPATAALFRALYALPVLYLLVRRWRRDRRSTRMRLMAIASGVLLAADVVLWHAAIEFVGAGLATVLANTQVLWVGAAAWLFFREHPRVTTFVAVPVVLTGVALIGGVGSTDAFGENPALGAVLGLVAGFFYAGFLLVFRRAASEGRADPGPLLDVTIGMALSFILGGWFDPGFSIEPSWPAHGWLMILGGLVHSGGWLLISTALPRLPSLDTSLMLLLQPALTMGWAALLFTERVSLLQGIGVALVLGGVLAAASRGSVRPPAPRTHSDL